MHERHVAVVAVTALLAESSDPTHAGHDAGILHYFCEDCDGPDLALCGLDISGDPLTDIVRDLPECVVCADLADTDCPHGGERRGQ